MLPSTTAHSNSTRKIMLSSQTSKSTNHQRFGSTGTITKADLEAPYFPETFSLQPSNHHRGHSLDRLMDHQDHSNTNPGNGKVSTNTGHNNQHTLREAQTQESTRPGHTHSSSSHSLDANLFTTFLHHSEGRLSGRAGSPEARNLLLDAAELPPVHPNDPYGQSLRSETVGFFIDPAISNGASNASQMPNQQIAIGQRHIAKLLETCLLIHHRQISDHHLHKGTTRPEQLSVAIAQR